MTVADREPAPEIGPRLQVIRKQHRMSLDDLSARSGISRSMLSQIERGEANPTFAILWNLTRALDLEFDELIGVQSATRQMAVEVTPNGLTPEIRTEDGLCVLRILSPAQTVGGVEWYDLTIAPGGALVSKPHSKGTMEHLTVREGALKVTAGGNDAVVAVGATARYAVDSPHAIRNEGKKPAKALLVVLNRP